MSLRFSLTVVVMCLVTGANAWAEEMRPGLWEYRMESVTSFGKEPAHSHSECITAKDIEAGQHLMQGKQTNACKVSNLKTDDSGFSYDLDCKDENVSLKGKASGRFTATTFNMESSFRFDPPVEGMSEMKTKISGKRTGDCSSASKSQ